MEPFPLFFFLFPNFQLRSIETETGSYGGPERGVGAWIEWGRHKSGRATLHSVGTPLKGQQHRMWYHRLTGKNSPACVFRACGAVNHLQKTWPGTGCLRKEIFTYLKVLPLKY